MKENFTFQQKTKLLTKLFDAGCNTEKKLQQLDMESILKIPGITIPYEPDYRVSEADQSQ